MHPTIALHVNDYDVPTINVFKFQFPPSTDFDAITTDFEASPNVIDYDFPSGDFSAKSRFFNINEFEQCEQRKPQSQ
jgi:hypothetical protein